ncbi:MAG: hypothetical protein IPP71_01565 [Bacteroidetes bacterium]|nr:hypothetical protein [Bacteroidota bacterium]
MENLTIDRITSSGNINSLNSNPNSTELPVIKYNFSGELISANSPGIEFLCTIKGNSLEKTIEYMISKYPHLLKHKCYVDFALNFLGVRYYFSAVSFDEAGYIGWYCYKTEMGTLSEVKSAA